MRSSLIFVVLAGLADQAVSQGSVASSGLGALPEVLAIPHGSSAQQGVWVTACAIGDVDGDGALDAVVTLVDGHDELYRGDGSGELVRVDDVALARQAGPSRDVELADLDNDGLLDVFVVAGDFAPNAVYVHVDGGPELVALSDLSPFDPSVTDVDSSYGVALGDLDDDGRVDAVVANLGQPSVIYANAGLDGVAAFHRLPDDLLAWPALRDGGGAHAVVVGDVDDDGDVDIVLTSSDERDFVYLARGESEFDFVKLTSGVEP